MVFLKELLKRVDLEKESDGKKNMKKIPTVGKELTDLLINSKTCVKRPLSKRRKIGFQDQLSLNTGQDFSSSSKGCGQTAHLQRLV